MQSKNIVFVAPGKAELTVEEVPELKPDQVLVELAVSTTSSGTERANLLGSDTVDWTSPPNPTPWGPVAEASPGTHAVTFSKSRWVRRRGWTGPCFRGWPGRARSTLQRALVGLGRRT